MDQAINQPTIDQIKDYLTEYGWHYKETQSNSGHDIVLTNYHLENNPNGVLISLTIQGEFVMVSTVDFILGVDQAHAHQLLELNDRLKLVKIYSVNQHPEKGIDAEIGFELWAGSWNKDTFFAFIDMLCFGIETTLKTLNTASIKHDSHFITYE